jgi:acyl-CoA synthetase (NDP forming)
VGRRHIAGRGHEAATSASDFLDVLVDDPQVSLVLANLESIRDPAAFFAAADRAAERGIPIVALKGGRSYAGQKAIATHTAALGGSPQAYAGAFRQHGIVQVTDLDELADTAALLTRSGPVAGNRVGVFSLAGGGTGLLSDIATDHGFTIAALDPVTEAGLAEILPKIAQPTNPLDTTAGFGRDSARLEAALTTFAADPNIDIVTFFPLASQVSYADGLVTTLISAQANVTKPLVVIWTAGQTLAPGPWRRLHEAGVPLFTSTSEAFRALRRARTYHEFVAARARPEAADFGPYLGTGVGLPAVADPADARTALSRFGISFPRTFLARTAAEAAEAVEHFGAAALKIASPDITHKTEAGGVRLGLRERTAAQAAFAEILESARTYAPDAALNGVEVQEMIESGLELLLGVHTDDQLGPIFTVAAGGVFTEILRDVAQRPVPISRYDAEQMLAELRIAPLFDGFRGGPRYDRAAAIDAMLGLSAFAHSVRESRPEIDLNPLVVGPEGHGAVAVDVLLKLTQAY